MLLVKQCKFNLVLINQLIVNNYRSSSAPIADTRSWGVLLYFWRSLAENCAFQYFLFRSTEGAAYCDHA